MDALGDDLSDVFSSWFEKQDQLGTAAGLFLGRLYNPRGPLEFQFLAFTQALESLHRRLVGGQYVSDEDYAAVEAEPFTRGLVQAHASLTICDDLTCVFPNRVDQTVRLRNTRG
jgi:hypothetical protein